MIRTALAVLVLSSVPCCTAAFAADASGTFDRTLSVSGTPNVNLSTGSGYIHVYPGTDTQFHVTGHVHASTGWFGTAPESRIRQVIADPPIVQSGNTITIGNRHADSDLFRNISIDYDVFTPRASTLRTATGSGGIEVGGIEGAVTAETGSGRIHVDNIGANAHLETGSGSIRATNVHGASYLQTGSGDLELSLTAAGDVKAETGSGSIRIDGITGALRATAGSGSIEITGNPTAEWRVESGSGGIHLNLPQAARFNLNAETGSGSVQVDRPIVLQGSLNKHHVSGTINGGGPTLRATTGSGSITLH